MGSPIFGHTETAIHARQTVKTVKTLSAVLVAMTYAIPSDSRS